MGSRLGTGFKEHYNKKMEGLRIVKRCTKENCVERQSQPGAVEPRKKEKKNSLVSEPENPDSTVYY